MSHLVYILQHHLTAFVKVIALLPKLCTEESESETHLPLAGVSTHLLLYSLAPDTAQQCLVFTSSKEGAFVFDALDAWDLKDFQLGKTTETWPLLSVVDTSTQTLRVSQTEEYIQLF